MLLTNKSKLQALLAGAKSPEDFKELLKMAYDQVSKSFEKSSDTDEKLNFEVRERNVIEIARQIEAPEGFTPQNEDDYYGYNFSQVNYHHE